GPHRPRHRARGLQDFRGNLATTVGQRQVEVGVAPPRAGRPGRVARRGRDVYFLAMLRFTLPRPVAAFTLASALLLGGCGMATTADWRRCSFDVTEVAFKGFRENQAEWRIVVAAVNPNGKRLSL